jgi:hypothetical protein
MTDMVSTYYFAVLRGPSRFYVFQHRRCLVFHSKDGTLYFFFQRAY